MVLEGLVRGVKYVAGGLALGASLLFGGAGFSGCMMDSDEEVRELTNFTAEAGDREVHLSWKNPTTIDMPGVMIRRDVDEYPVDENDGVLIYQGTDESVIDTGLDHSVNYCYKAFSYSFADPMIIRTIREASAIPYDATAPGEILELSTSSQSDGFKFNWTNPADSDFVGVLIVRRQDDFPVDRNDGTIIYDGSAQTFEDTGMVEGDSFCYAIFTYDDSLNYSNGITFFREVDNMRAIGWIGGGVDGWQTTYGANSTNDYRGFRYPSDVFVDAAGNIYVADTYNHRISKWNSAGIAQGIIGFGVNGWQLASGYVSSGRDLRSFKYPEGVAVDATGRIYVADTQNNRICRWNANGEAQGWIGGGSEGWHQEDGASASDDYRSFNNPTSVTVNSAGNLLIADNGNNRICAWNPSDGTAIGWIGKTAGGDTDDDGWKTDPSGGYAISKLSSPRGVASFGSFICVTDDINGASWYHAILDQDWFFPENGLSPANRIAVAPDFTKYITRGHVVAKRVPKNVPTVQYTVWYTSWFGGGSGEWKTGPEPTSGSSTHQSLDNPCGIYVVGDTVYIADKDNQRISKWVEHDP